MENSPYRSPAITSLHDARQCLVRLGILFGYLDENDRMLVELNEALELDGTAISEYLQSSVTHLHCTNKSREISLRYEWAGKKYQAAVNYSDLQTYRSLFQQFMHYKARFRLN